MSIYKSHIYVLTVSQHEMCVHVLSDKQELNYVSSVRTQDAT